MFHVKKHKNIAKSTPTRRQWASQINAAWRKSVSAIFETGRILIAAKASLEHGQWETMCANDLKFNPRVAQMLMAIEEDRRLAKPKIFSLLPPAYTTIYQISQLEDGSLEARVADGTIQPNMKGRELVTQIKQTRRAHREQDLGSKQKELPQQKFGVIVADPEWHDETWGGEKTGMNRHAANHYPTQSTEVIASRDVASIAAPDCVLFLWSTNQHLREAISVMEAWGFAYKSNYCWGKNKISLGFWSRGKHELLLVGTCGAPPCPAPGTQRESLIVAPKGKHSAKPEIFLEMIEQYFPTMPKIELNRRGKARPGWTAWGNEAE